MATKPNVNTQMLRNMIVEMMIQYEVLNVMEEVGEDTRNLKFTGRGDGKFQWRVAWSPNGVYNLFHGCDSVYHNKDRNQVTHSFTPTRGESFDCLGTEINYYVQGALFRCFDCTFQYAVGFAITWKDWSGHGSLNSNCQYFMREGWCDIKHMWPQVLQRFDHLKNMRAKTKRATPIAVKPARMVPGMGQRVHGRMVQH